MPRYILKLSDAGKDYYMEWSTVVDAPVSLGVSLEEFKEYYRFQYGNSAMLDLEDRLIRVEKNGCSCKDESADECIAYNRAGENEACLTKQEIIEKYCRSLTAPSG